eukprot:scaffold5033_cov106-Isochrysis_galbana.AAC.4
MVPPRGYIKTLSVERCIRIICTVHGRSTGAGRILSETRGGNCACSGGVRAGSRKGVRDGTPCRSTERESLERPYVGLT